MEQPEKAQNARNAPVESGSPRTSKQRLAALSLGALGVVFGDIGTSPLYSIRECFGHRGLAVNEANVLGLLSVVVWSLIIVVTIKYLFFVMRADNRGEGGILALLTLVVPPDRRGERRNAGLVIGGIFGATLLYGDGMITPAISVLSAVEGLEVATPFFSPYIVPIAVLILIGLFSVQRHGTAAVGAVFGPIMLVWFAALAALGLVWIVRWPQVLGAVNPWLALRFFAANGAEGFLVLGSVLLVVTGAEALYADMGHFGRRPIRLAWLVMVFPCLMLNYFGQGALLLAQPEAVSNPFFNMAPSWALYPLVVLATAATVIASQAVISGAFSLTRQALQLGYSPRMEVLHSSAHQIGQVYVPVVNWLLLVATLALVVGFGSSAALAGAYGIAVSLTMVVTTGLATVCAHRLWGWSKMLALAIGCGFLLVDMAFFGAAVTKIVDGGWLPLVVAGLIYSVMNTWRRGADLLDDYAKAARLPVEYFLADLDAHPMTRVSGTAIVMDARGVGVPRTLLHNIKHNKVLHERIVLLTLRTAEVPHVVAQERVRVQFYRPDFLRVVARYGFMETPSVAEVLALLATRDVDVDPMQATFFFGRETLVIGRKAGMSTWRKYLYDFLFRNAYGAYLHMGVPPNRVIEIGQQVEI
ncbi:MAG: potassium transporter Kup [Deltaproteobacteria bacterium]|nr:potassium transporter Kup [Deltaproteobacteria bacterium]